MHELLFTLSNSSLPLPARSHDDVAETLHVSFFPPPRSNQFGRSRQSPRSVSHFVSSFATSSTREQRCLKTRLSVSRPHHELPWILMPPTRIPTPCPRNRCFQKERGCFCSENDLKRSKLALVWYHLPLPIIPFVILPALLIEGSLANRSTIELAHPIP